MKLANVTLSEKSQSHTHTQTYYMVLLIRNVHCTHLLRPRVDQQLPGDLCCICLNFSVPLILLHAFSKILQHLCHLPPDNFLPALQKHWFHSSWRPEASLRTRRFCFSLDWFSSRPALSFYF